MGWRTWNNGNLRIRSQKLTELYQRQMGVCLLIGLLVCRRLANVIMAVTNYRFEGRIWARPILRPYEEVLVGRDCLVERPGGCVTVVLIVQDKLPALAMVVQMWLFTTTLVEYK